MIKWGVLLNISNNIFIELYKENSLTEYDYIVEQDSYSISYGRGSGYAKYFKNGTLVKIEKNDWYASPIVVLTTEPRSRTDVKVEFFDPKGKSKSLHLKDDTSFGLINELTFLFKKLDECSNFIDWSHFDLIADNVKLKIEIEKLNERIKLLKKKEP